jgi:hypothetical protein
MFQSHGNALQAWRHAVAGGRTPHKTSAGHGAAEDCEGDRESIFSADFRLSDHFVAASDYDSCRYHRHAVHTRSAKRQTASLQIVYHVGGRCRRAMRNAVRLGSTMSSFDQ